jgi:hypothetical protein
MDDFVWVTDLPIKKDHNKINFILNLAISFALGGTVGFIFDYVLRNIFNINISNMFSFIWG